MYEPIVCPLRALKHTAYSRPGKLLHGFKITAHLATNFKAVVAERFRFASICTLTKRRTIAER